MAGVMALKLLISGEMALEQPKLKMDGELEVHLHKMKMLLPGPREEVEKKEVRQRSQRVLLMRNTNPL